MRFRQRRYPQTWIPNFCRRSERRLRQKEFRKMRLPGSARGQLPPIFVLRELYPTSLFGRRWLRFTSHSVDYSCSRSGKCQSFLAYPTGACSSHRRFAVNAGLAIFPAFAFRVLLGLSHTHIGNTACTRLGRARTQRPLLDYHQPLGVHWQLTSAPLRNRHLYDRPSTGNCQIACEYGDVHSGNDRPWSYL